MSALTTEHEPKSKSELASILIVGSGCYGISTALSLIEGDYRDHPELITLLDRSEDPPAIDAAVYDYNKIIRQEYADPVYARLAHSAMDRWRLPPWSQDYYECGVIVTVAAGATQKDYVRSALEVNSLPGMETEGKRAYILEGQRGFERVFPPGVSLGDFETSQCYINEAGGWGNSRGAAQNGVKRLRAAGVNFVAGEAQQLLYTPKQETRSKRCKGVRTVSGQIYVADLVILTAGSWTSKLVPELGEELLPTGQVVGMMQLDADEADLYRRSPVVRIVDQGFYVFPPTADNVVKFAIHAKGYLNPTSSLPSEPRTVLTPGYENQSVPPEAAKALQRGMETVYPELAKKSWLKSRLCWYSDRPSGDWLIDYHPEVDNLFIASGCCGHAFKFMPILGDLVIQGITRTLPKEHRQIWAYKHQVPGREDASRAFTRHLYLRGSSGATHL